VKRYDLFVDGCYSPLTAAQIAQLVGAGRLNTGDFCKETTRSAWTTLGQLFPELVRDSVGVDETLGQQHDGPRRPTTTHAVLRTSLKVAGVCAIAAAVLLTTFLSQPLLAKLGRQPRRVPRPPEQILADLNATARPLQTISYAITSSTLSLPPRQLHDNELGAAAPGGDSRAALDQTPSAPDDLQKSIDWYDDQIQLCRSRGRDARWFEEHRNALLQKRDRIAGR
jgi:hypothetical protein